ncbi:MAG: 30S ribosomal protein S20 [Simkania sp.]|nr:30S ribosomal protein S20 [Simkania sp.]
MANEQEKAPAKEKRPTALKRDAQNERRRLANRSFKAEVNTAIRGFKEAASKKDTAAAKAQLSAVYSLLDKGVKTGAHKLNKASRTKSRLSQEISA